MDAISCLTITQPIRDLAVKFVGETEESIKNAVGLWQEKYNKGMEEIPTASELNKFLKEIRPKTINIYAGTGENADLSNFAERPFSFTSAVSGDTVIYKTVEGAFQAAKLGYSNISEAEKIDIEKRLMNASGAEARKIGRSIKELATDAWDLNSSSIMEKLIYQSFKQNPNALQRLLATGNAILTHTQDKGKWGKEFPRILMQVRLQLDAETNVLAGFDENGNPLNENTISSSPSIKNFENLTTPTPVSLQEQKKVYLDFDPVKRRNRVSLIATLFSNILTMEVEQSKQILTEAISLAEPEERDVLLQQLNNVDRISTISKLTPGNIFVQIRDIFKPYTEISEEDRIAIEMESDSTLSKEEAKAVADYKFNEYNKIVDNFRALAEEACQIIARTESVKISPAYYGVSEASFADADPEGQDQGTVLADDALTREESVKDGWMIEYLNSSSMSSLSENVRKAIMTMPRLDKNGLVEKDDLGFDIYLDADYVHATLIDKLKDMITFDDMDGILQDLTKSKPWVSYIIQKLNQDKALQSQFYQDFRKDFNEFWIQKRKVDNNGHVTWETVPVNKPEGTYYLLDAWRDNYESGTTLDKDSIYDKTGSIVKENAAIGLELTNELQSQFNKLSTDEAVNELQKKETFSKFVKLLRMIGIDTSEDSIKEALTNIIEVEGATITPPYTLMLGDLNILFSGVKKGEVKDTEDTNGDLINTFGSVYNSIALALSEVTEDAIESSTRENDKSYYAHTNPNYAGKIIKLLKNVRKVSESEYQKFLEKEYGKYEWFKKDGIWLNDVIRELAESPEMRKQLEHKMLLNADKKEFDNWDDLDTLLVLLTEYGGITDAPTKSKYAYYNFPIQGDAAQAEFIKLRRYVTGDELDENGKNKSFEDIIAEKMVNLVLQEYNRIMLVRARDEKLKAGDTSISPIASFDIVRDKDGNIKWWGGAEFKFLPQLNNVKGFIENITNLVKNGSGETLRNYIKDTVKETMENSFEEDYLRMDKAGLFEETEDGNYKYLKGKGKKQFLRQLSDKLKTAKNMLGNAWTNEMSSLCINNKADCVISVEK